MIKHKINRSKLYTVLALSGLLLLILWPSFVQAIPLTDQQRLEGAWRSAGQTGSYRYQSNLLQTTHPTNKLVNV